MQSNSHQTSHLRFLVWKRHVGKEAPQSSTQQILVFSPIRQCASSALDFPRASQADTNHKLGTMQAQQRFVRRAPTDRATDIQAARQDFRRQFQYLLAFHGLSPSKIAHHQANPARAMPENGHQHPSSASAAEQSLSSCTTQRSLRLMT